jgi:hypothetical protein
VIATLMLPWAVADGAEDPAEPAANWIADRWIQRWHPEMT